VIRKAGEVDEKNPLKFLEFDMLAFALVEKLIQLSVGTTD
jgi:hypothetical protein